MSKQVSKQLWAVGQLGLSLIHLPKVRLFGFAQSDEPKGTIDICKTCRYLMKAGGEIGGIDFIQARFYACIIVQKSISDVPDGNILIQCFCLNSCILVLKMIQKFKELQINYKYSPIPYTLNESLHHIHNKQFKS